MSVVNGRAERKENRRRSSSRRRRHAASLRARFYLGTLSRYLCAFPPRCAHRCTNSSVTPTKYIKSGWIVRGAREGRLLITRRVDQPFSFLFPLAPSTFQSPFLPRVTALSLFPFPPSLSRAHSFLFLSSFSSCQNVASSLRLKCSSRLFLSSFLSHQPFCPICFAFFLSPGDWSSSGSTNPSLPASSSYNLPISLAYRILLSREHGAARFVTQERNRITPTRFVPFLPTACPSLDPAGSTYPSP